MEKQEDLTKIQHEKASFFGEGAGFRFRGFRFRFEGLGLRIEEFRVQGLWALNYFPVASYCKLNPPKVTIFQGTYWFMGRRVA